MALTENSYISQKNVNGTYEILNRSHHLVDMVLDQQLNLAHLKQYPVLMLTNSCLSDAQCDEIRQYVRGGGTLLANHESSLRDEFGQARGNFALADLFGVDFAGPIGDDTPHGIVYVPHDAGLKSAFEHVICFAACESAVKVRGDANTEVLCTRSNLGTELPLGDFDANSEYDSGEPAVTTNRVGEGQVIYINSDVGDGYMHNPFPLLQRFVSLLVQRAEAPVEVTAPEAIEVTAALRGPKELMVHLLNDPTPLVPMHMTEKHEGMNTHLYLRELNPIYNVEVRFNGFEVESARLPLSGLDLEVKGSIVVVPKVELHEVVLAQLS